jgi:hypothetical protein
VIINTLHDSGIESSFLNELKNKNIQKTYITGVSPPSTFISKVISEVNKSSSHVVLVKDAICGVKLGNQKGVEIADTNRLVW